jgi:hypothetical protein
MLVPCPECARQVSDKAKACPDCAFPLAEHLAETRREALAQEARLNRERVGEVDCVPCNARGFVQISLDPKDKENWAFEWCLACEHTGRLVLVRSSIGYYGVAEYEAQAFLAGSLEPNDKTVFFLGEDEPQGHRYPKAGPRMKRNEG